MSAGYSLLTGCNGVRPARRRLTMGGGHDQTTWTRFLHRHFLWLLIGTYALATQAPHPGLWVSQLATHLGICGLEVRLSAPAGLLAFLLFTAGLAVKGSHLRDVLQRPAVLTFGLAASLLVPVVFLIVASPLFALWHDPTEVIDLVVGLAVVAAMPVAGSSAAWSRSADGDGALSLGLVLLSTLLSPLTTPIALRAIGLFAPGGVGGELDRLAEAGGVGVFLAAWVVVPMALGLFARWSIGGTRADAAGAWLKPTTSMALLVLCYANASTCLPGIVADPDWDFLALVVVAVVLMSGTVFVAGFGVAHAVRADPARRAALVFGVGMANNGAGLSLASSALTASPVALIPVVAINLIQHIVAGIASRRLA